MHRPQKAARFQIGWTNQPSHLPFRFYAISAATNPHLCGAYQCQPNAKLAKGSPLYQPLSQHHRWLADQYMPTKHGPARGLGASDRRDRARPRTSNRWTWPIVTNRGSAIRSGSCKVSATKASRAALAALDVCPRRGQQAHPRNPEHHWQWQWPQQSHA